MKTRIAWIVIVLFGAAMLLAWTQSSTTAAVPSGGPLDLADAIVSSRPITIATTADSLVFAAGENSRIVMYSSGEIVIKGKKITFEADERIDINTLLAYTDSSSLTPPGVYMNTAGAISLLTENGGTDISAPNGTIEIKATTLKSEVRGDETHKSANTKIEAMQDYSVKATNIKEEATMDYKNKGMNVKSEASMEHKIKGMNVTTEAGVNMQVKGTMVTVQSSGPNTIKGMPVMIN